MVDFEPYIPHGVPVLMSELLDFKGGLASNRGVISVVARLQMFNAEEQYALLYDPMVDISSVDETVSKLGVSLPRSSCSFNALIVDTHLLDCGMCFVPNRLYIVIGEICNRGGKEEDATLEPAEKHPKLSSVSIRARAFQMVDGLNLDLYHKTVHLLRQFMAKRQT
eukprot:282018_1